mmetsp:Transcript_74177/g.130963  ORF Transcript_74177/g.130963 Transcript_74177/m.130963 type:complete len:282 (-) Transcript_74177:79-924(-)
MALACHVVDGQAAAGMGLHQEGGLTARLPLLKGLTNRLVELLQALQTLLLGPLAQQPLLHPAAHVLDQLQLLPGVLLPLANLHPPTGLVQQQNLQPEKHPLHGRLLPHQQLPHFLLLLLQDLQLVQQEVEANLLALVVEYLLNPCTLRALLVLQDAVLLLTLIQQVLGPLLHLLLEGGLQHHGFLALPDLLQVQDEELDTLGELLSQDPALPLLIHAELVTLGVLLAVQPPRSFQELELLLPAAGLVLVQDCLVLPKNLFPSLFLGECGLVPTHLLQLVRG